MKEILNTAKKIRKVLINFIDVELRKNSKKNNNVLIDSKSPEELSKQYQKFSDYRMEIIETYNGSPTNNAITSFNNFYHVVVSYSKINNNFQVSYENKNFEKVTSNDIVGKYVKEKNVRRISKYENEKNSFHDISRDNKKKMIGNKKFNHKRRSLLSSIEIPQKVLMEFDENNSDNLNNKKSIDIENKINNKERNEIICANKKRKLKVNYYENKLKKYCSNLILLKRKRIAIKHTDPKSPPLKLKTKMFKKNNTLNKNNEQHIIETPNVIKIKDTKDKTDTKAPNSKTQHKKKDQKSKDNKLFKIQEKKPGHKRARAQSIKNTHHFLKAMKSFHKKNDKNISPKKMQKQLLVTQNDSKNKEMISQKITRKERGKNPEDIDVKKMISGNVRSKRKMPGEKATVKWSNKAFQMENKFNFGEQRSLRKPLYKRANTINKMNNIFHFKGSEIKFKDN